jgi:hypothetical protein
LHQNARAPKPRDHRADCADKIKGFGEDGLSGQPGQAIAVMGFDTQFVPVVVPIHAGKYSAGVNQSGRKSG